MFNFQTDIVYRWCDLETSKKRIEQNFKRFFEIIENIEILEETKRKNKIQDFSFPFVNEVKTIEIVVKTIEIANNTDFNINLCCGAHQEFMLEPKSVTEVKINDNDLICIDSIATSHKHTKMKNIPCSDDIKKSINKAIEKLNY